MKSPWLLYARYVLAVWNVVIVLSMVAFAVLAFATGREHHVGASVWFTVLPALAGAGLFSFLTRELTQRRGRVLQTVVAVGVLGLAALTDWSPMYVFYAVFALLTVWWLGDFDGSGPKPAKRLEGTPHEVARFMWRRGDSSDAIRAELAARQMPADEVEQLMYELTVEEETRQRMSPGR